MHESNSCKFKPETLRAVANLSNEQIGRLLKVDPQFTANYQRDMTLIDESADDDNTKDRNKLLCTCKAAMSLSDNYTKTVDVAEIVLVNGIVHLVLAGGFNYLVQFGSINFLKMLQNAYVESKFYRVLTPRMFQNKFKSRHKLGPEEEWTKEIKNRYDIAMDEHTAKCAEIYATDDRLKEVGAKYDKEFKMKDSGLDNYGVRYNDRQSTAAVSQFKRTKEIITATMNTNIVQLARKYGEDKKAKNENFSDDEIAQFLSSAILNVGTVDDIVDGDEDVLSCLRGTCLSWDDINDKVAEAAMLKLQAIDAENTTTTALKRKQDQQVNGDATGTSNCQYVCCCYVSSLLGVVQVVPVL